MLLSIRSVVSNVYILASPLSFKAFRAAVDFLVLLWRLLEVVLSLLMVSRHLVTPVLLFSDVISVDQRRSF